MTTACCTKCFYCDGPLSPRHEHDHFPIPERNGGTETVPACASCHDLKDRIYLRNWDDALVQDALAQMGPLGRILAGKLSALISDFEANEPEPTVAGAA